MSSPRSPGGKPRHLRVLPSRVAPVHVRGRFDRARRITFALLMAFLVSWPFVRIHDRPAVWLDIPQRRFHVFAASFGAQDTYLFFFVLAGLAFGIVLLTTLLGRVWCGWTCPQTVFLEGLFRPLERWWVGEGSKLHSASPLRRVGLQASFVLLSVVLAHAFVAYFVPLEQLRVLVGQGPASSPTAFAWVVGTSAIFYGNFAFFREKTCTVVCPYGRMQSVLFDRDTLLVGYDVTRGEPRGKLQRSRPTNEVESRGDCIDCGKCVRVCPTGIDIRDGSQVDCIACTACIDACDGIMDGVGKPRGLIRYDSLNGFEGRRQRILRPRLGLYGGVLVLGVAAAAYAFSSRSEVEANMLRLAGAPYLVTEHGVRNGFELHLVNKSDRAAHVELRPRAPELQFALPAASLDLAAYESRRVPVFVTGERAQTVWIDVVMGERVRPVQAQFLAPPRP